MYVVIVRKKIYVILIFRLFIMSKQRLVTYSQKP